MTSAENGLLNIKLDSLQGVRAIDIGRNWLHNLWKEAECVRGIASGHSVPVSHGSGRSLAYMLGLASFPDLHQSFKFVACRMKRLETRLYYRAENKTSGLAGQTEDLIGHLYNFNISMIKFWPAIVENCTENGLGPAVIFSSVLGPQFDTSMSPSTSTFHYRASSLLQTGKVKVQLLSVLP